jgi:hypothetical protein
MTTHGTSWRLIARRMAPKFIYFHVYRMPTVSVMLASKCGVEFTTQPGDTFSKVLQCSRDAAEEATGMNIPLQPIVVMYSNSNLPVPGWQEPQRLVGMRDVTVVMQAAPLRDVIESLSLRLSAMESTVTVLAVPRISNCAAQILLHAAGEKFRTTTSTIYAAMGATDAIQLLSSLTSLPSSRIVSGADGVIQRRNNFHVHFANAAALDTEVQQCAQIIVSNPTLRQQHKWECWVIENFDKFKVAFTAVFDT